MGNSIEKTNLENFKLLILDCKEHRKLYNESFVSEDDIETMNNILSDYKRVLKENEELRKLIAHKNGYTKKLEEDLFENCSNYVIPVQKIKDKIEEVEKIKQEYEEENTMDEDYYFDINAYNSVIFVLQELLESE